MVLCRVLHGNFVGHEVVITSASSTKGMGGDDGRKKIQLISISLSSENFEGTESRIISSRIVEACSFIPK